MTIIHAIILGIVQGLTEFLPISSSAHLNVFPWIFNWEMLSEGMDVALHIGTLLALVIFFFKDWVNLVKGRYKKAIKKEKPRQATAFVSPDFPEERSWRAGRLPEPAGPG